MDDRFSQSDNFFTRFSYENQPSIIPGTFSNVLDGGGFFQGIEDNAYCSVALREMHLFTPTLVNEFRLGYNRINSHRLQFNFDKNISGDPTFGIEFPGVPFAPAPATVVCPASLFPMAVPAPGERLVPISSCEHDNTIIWQSPFDSLCAAETALKRIQDNVEHMELASKQHPLFQQSWVEFYEVLQY